MNKCILCIFSCRALNVSLLIIRPHRDRAILLLQRTRIRNAWNTASSDLRGRPSCFAASLQLESILHANLDHEEKHADYILHHFLYHTQQQCNALA